MSTARTDLTSLDGNVGSIQATAPALHRVGLIRPGAPGRIGELVPAVLTPEDVELLRGCPSHRRSPVRLERVACRGSSRQYRTARVQGRTRVSRPGAVVELPQVQGLSQRPSALAASTSASPPGRIRPASVSIATLAMLIRDHLLPGRRRA